MSSPRSRRVLKELKLKNGNKVRHLIVKFITNNKTTEKN